MILPRVVLEVAPASRWWVSSVGRKSNIHFTRERDRRCVGLERLTKGLSNKNS